MMRRFFAALSSLVCFLATATGEPKALELAAIHNAFDLGDGVYSGSSPEGEAGFAALAQLGVKTIVSVDGAKPDVEAARKFGLRYVHLPIGYDGVPAERAMALAQVANLPGPVFIHCHHGKHRGPAAVAIVCQTRSGWSAGEAAAWMKSAGTADDYAGLYRSVREFRVPSAAALAKAPAALPEFTPTPSLVDAMVAIDEHFDWLNAAEKSGWGKIPGHPDLTAAQVSTLLWEQLREMQRDPETQKRAADFRARLTESEHAAARLRELLREPSQTGAARTAALQRMTKSCIDCHQAHRN